MLTAGIMVSAGYYIYQNNDNANKKKLGKATYVASYFLPFLNSTFRTTQNLKILPAKKLSVQYIAPKIKQTQIYYKNASKIRKLTNAIYEIEQMVYIAPDILNTDKEVTYKTLSIALSALVTSIGVYAYKNPDFKSALTKAGFILSGVDCQFLASQDEVRKNCSVKDKKNRLSYFENIGHNIHNNINQQIKNFTNYVNKKTLNSLVSKVQKSVSSTSKISKYK